VHKQDIRTTVRKAPGGMMTVTGPDGRGYQVRPEALQAAETGPVKAGGATGLGKPRQTGPAASSPGNGPHRALPGDVADRKVVKARRPGGEARFAGVVRAGEAFIAANRRQRLGR
jgi:hypothetical protein